MTDCCEQIQRSLIEASQGTLAPDAERHLAACPECRDAADAVLEAGALLSDAAARAETCPQARLAPALREQVRRQALARLAGPVPLARPVSAPAGPARTWWTGLTLRPAWGMAIAALALLAWLGATQGSTPAAGSLDFAWGAVTIRQTDGVSVREGLADAPLALAALVETGENGRALLSVGPDGRARVALDQGTQLRLAGTDRIELLSGAIWLQVRPEGRGFQVVTPTGAVRVTGTRFGVAVGLDQTQVDVSEGSVLVTASASGSQTSLHAGESVGFDADTMGALHSRPLGTALPDWVMQLGARDDLVEDLHYLPTLLGKERR